MNKKVYILYDDSRKPSWDIRNITGQKGFGDTIFKRLTLREHTRRYYESLQEVALFAEPKDMIRLKFESNTPVILIYSDVIALGKDDLEILVNKALYSHDNYKITQNNKIACVIFPSLAAYTDADEESYNSFLEIKVDCFIDISDINNFRQFITSGFEARFFNSLKGDEYTLVKSSENKDKLRAEYEMYNLLPENMKQWFVRPYDYEDKGDSSSYKMQRFHMTDLAIRYIHQSIDIEEFEDILNKLFHFISIRKVCDISVDEYEKIATATYIEKVEKRISQLKESKGYEEIASLIASSTKYNDIDEIVERYKSVYKNIRQNKSFLSVKVVGHGDLCFSNILYSKETSLMMLIDPKGATIEEELYMDPYYDLAKLSHSICGHYDFYNSDLYEITIDDDLKSHLSVFADNRQYVEAFKQKLNSMGIDFRLVRLYEASLFLSMLPLHMDRPKKVYAFILNAIDIINSIEL